MFRLCTKTVTQVRVIVATPPDRLRILYLDLNLGAKRGFSVPIAVFALQSGDVRVGVV